MKRSSVVLSIGLAVGLLGLVIAGYQLVSSPAGTAERNSSLDPRMEERIGRLEAAAESTARLLGALEKRVASLSSAREESEPGPAEESPQPASSENPPYSSEAPEPKELSLASRVAVLEKQIQDLEEAPISRAYSYLESENEQLRRKGILELEKYAAQDPEALATIRELLFDPSGNVRQWALDTLADLGDKESAGAMAALLADESEKVRFEAVYSLGRIGARQFQNEIASLLYDESDRVRARAAAALGKIKASGCVGILIEALADPNEDVRYHAIGSLGEIGDKSAVPYLQRVIETNPGKHRMRLADALKKLGHTDPPRHE